MAPKLKHSSNLHRMISLALVALFVVSLTGPVGLVQVQAAGGQLAAGVLNASRLSGLAKVNQAQLATTNTVFLNVLAARDEPLWDDPNAATDGPEGITKGTPITDYEFLINIDNVGDPFDAGGGTSYDPAAGGTYTPNPDCIPYVVDPVTEEKSANPNYPGTCEWPGVHNIAGWSPIYTRGDHTYLNGTTGITLPDGDYLISVMAHGFKLDGIHFSLPMEEPGLLDVQLHPLPLPPATMVIKVFNDNRMTNGQYDAPGEVGLPGFRASINDIMGEITTDLYGNPLCTMYEKDANGVVLLDADGLPIVKTLGAGCYSDSEGMITIPNIGPLRYDVLVIPPDGQTWIQTTTLEGSQGWDTWLQEAGTGLDNEFVLAGEPFPWTIFGFVEPSTAGLPVADGTGTITGVIMAAEVFTPFQGGLPYQGQQWGGLMGAKLDKPIAFAWLALNDLGANDTAIWVGQADAEGAFTIPNVPEGNYLLTYWDEQQHYILEWEQFTVTAGAVTDLGINMLTGWFARFYGTVFHDYNENGHRDPGEPGVPNYTVVLKDRDNTEIDRMSIVSVTDDNGYYSFEKGYPMTAWMILEAYSDIYKTTGVTYQTSGQLTETTVIEPGLVDMAVLPIIGQSGRLDWGVKFYEPTQNGGIAGTVTYDTMRAEDNAQMAGAEPYQPGIPDLTVNLYATVRDGSGNFVKNTDGSLMKGNLLNTTTTETFERPTGCIARDIDGNPIDMISALGDFNNLTIECLEAPMMGLQFGGTQNALDGNYGFADACYGAGGAIAENTCADGNLPEPIVTGDYLVEVEIPTDPINGLPIFQVTREEDLNMFTGDTYTPLMLPPPCAGALHTVDVMDSGIDNYPEIVLTGGITVTASTPVHNPGYADFGGSRYEGQQMPLCDTKLVTVTGGKGIAPIFTLFTEVPIPGRWKGYLIDDLNLSTDPMELFFGEKAGLHYMPIGFYDYTGRLVHTLVSDFHGVYEVLLPSTGTFNAPTPSGMLANVYYIYGNDPGPVGHPNPTYNPQYRSIGTSFEVYPGVWIPSDLAPVTNGALIQAPNSNLVQPAPCKLEDTDPQFFAIDNPYVDLRGAAAPPTVNIQGLGFGTLAGAVTIDGAPLNVTAWTDRSITATVPLTSPAGPHQLQITTAAGLKTVNAITFHVINPGYTPNVYRVGPGLTGQNTFDPANYFISTDPNYDGTYGGAIQAAIDVAAKSTGNDLIVVYPGLQPTFTETPMYLENLVIYTPLKLQGVGPGGVYGDGTRVPGTILDGRAVGGDTPYSTYWRTVLIPTIWNRFPGNQTGWDGGLIDAEGNPIVYDGPGITVFAKNNSFGASFKAAIDGFTIQGGDQQGFPNNLNPVGGTPTGVPANVVVQGGGIFVNAYARFLQITNNLVQSNGGAYGGGIRIGTPHLPGDLNDNQNDNLRIANNRVIANGGTNLAGGIGLFAGSQGYEVAYNDLCGNFSAEYGGGISHYGLSPDSKIHHNRIYFNRSYDEGGGIMIAGELPVLATDPSTGAGSVEVYDNILEANLANDDGGGLRFLMAGAFNYKVYNNFIVNNISTHEGGGISLFDAPYVAVYNNTIMNNITTATSMTSTGFPAPAGLSTVRNSNILQRELPVDDPLFSNPVVFNNIFWDNRAGTFLGSGVAGIGLPGDTSDILYWDLGVADASGTLNPAYNLFQVPAGGINNITGWDPLVFEEYNTSIRVLPWRGNPNFVGANLISLDLPVGIPGDYHITLDSPARERGVSLWDGVAAPAFDIDDEARLSFGLNELGADEIPVDFPATPLLYTLGGTTAQASLQSTIQAPLPFRVFLPLINRASTSVPLPAGSGWQGLEEVFVIQDGSVRPLTTGYMYWDTATFGDSQEVYLTLEQVGQSVKQGLILKVAGLAPDGTLGPDSSLVSVTYDGSLGAVLIETLSPGGIWQEQARYDGASLLAGDVLGARATAAGAVEVFRNGIRVGAVDLSTTWEFFDQAGKVGVWFSGTDFTGLNQAGFDMFGGGTTPVK